MRRFKKIRWKLIATSIIILVIALVVTMAISTNRFGKAVTEFAKDDSQRTAEDNAVHTPLESLSRHQTPRIGLMKGRG
jgi:flagellar basal body-associated protein FliL